MPRRLLVALASLALVVLAPTARAQVSFGAVGGNVSVTLAQDVSFTLDAEAPGTEALFLRFLLKGAYVAPPEPPQQFTGVTSNTMTLRRNGVLVPFENTTLNGPSTFSFGTLALTDFALGFFSFDFLDRATVGSVWTLTAGTMVTRVPVAFAPTQAPGSMVMVSNSAIRLAEPILFSSTVPEPGALTLAGTGLVVLLGARAGRRLARRG